MDPTKSEKFTIIGPTIIFSTSRVSENEDNFFIMEEVYAVIAGDELTSPKDAKNSLDWLEWEIVMQAELNLSKKKEIWELIENLPDAISIANYL